ncbi:SEC-C domain-containing protein [Acidovorax sp. SD340]|nr:SEC-C domain-containing protein [Acidovorax sp. SD340]
MSGEGAAGVLAKATSPAAHPAGPALGSRPFCRRARHRHMSSRNAPCHCGSGKKYKCVTGLG